VVATALFLTWVTGELVAPRNRGAPPIEQAASVLLTSLPFLIPIVTSALAIAGGSSMRRAQSWPLAMTGAMVGLIPCLGPMLGLSIPVAFWALVVLRRPEIRARFE
jgi:hypothetical protein